jgi:hypothetical protein
MCGEPTGHSIGVQRDTIESPTNSAPLAAIAYFIGTRGRLAGDLPLPDARCLHAFEEIDGLFPPMVAQKEARYVVALRCLDLPKPSRARLANVIYRHIGPFPTHKAG